MNKYSHCDNQLVKPEVADVYAAPVRVRRSSQQTRRIQANTLWIIALTCLLIAGFIATLFSVGRAECLADANRVTSFTIQGSALDAHATLQSLEASTRSDEVPSLTFWEQRSLEKVENPTLGRSTRTNVVLAQGKVDTLIKGAFLPEQDMAKLAGATDQAIPDPATLPRAFEQENEIPPCIIDISTALELFGDSDVVGLPVRYGSEDFVIEMIIESARPLFLARPTLETGVAFDMVTAYNGSAQSASTLSEQLVSSLGLELEALDYVLLYFLASLLSWLPTLLLAGAYLVFLFVQGFVRSNTARQQALYILGFLCCFVALIAFSVKNVHIPLDMIPSRFSDFALWQQLFDDKGAALAYLFDAPVYVDSARLHDSFLAVVTLSVISLILYLGAIGALVRTRSSSHNSRHTVKRVMLERRPSVSMPTTSSPNHTSKNVPFAIPLGTRNHKRGRHV